MSFQFKINNKCSLFFAFIFLFIFASYSKVALGESKVILLAPYKLGDFYLETSKEVFKIAKEKTTIANYPLPEIFKMMKSLSHKKDELIYSTVAVKNEKNTSHFFNIGTILEVDTAFFTLKENNYVINKFDDVQKLNKVCVWLDSVLHRYLKNQGLKNLYLVPKASQCANLLASKEVDVWFNTESNVVKDAKKMKIDLQSIKKGFSPFKVTFFLAISKNASPDFLKKLQLAEKQMKNSGKYKEIISKYEDTLFLPR